MRRVFFCRNGQVPVVPSIEMLKSFLPQGNGGHGEIYMGHESDIDLDMPDALKFDDGRQIRVSEWCPRVAVEDAVSVRAYGVLLSSDGSIFVGAPTIPDVLHLKNGCSIHVSEWSPVIRRNEPVHVTVVGYLARPGGRHV